MLDYIPLTTTAARRTTTAELRALALERMAHLGYAWVGGELSPPASGMRFDVIGVSKYTRQVRIYEVKSSRADFLSDGKWPRYLDFCTHFAFVAPAGAIQRWELPREVGLVEYGAPPLERMLRARRFGMTIRREDCLRATRPSLRLRDAVGDAQWIAILEAMCLASLGGHDEPSYEEGAGI